MGWLRIVRPGSVIGPQQQFLCDSEGTIRAAGEGFRRRGGAAVRLAAGVTAGELCEFIASAIANLKRFRFRPRVVGGSALRTGRWSVTRCMVDDDGQLHPTSRTRRCKLLAAEPAINPAAGQWKVKGRRTETAPPKTNTTNILYLLLCWILRLSFLGLQESNSFLWTRLEFCAYPSRSFQMCVGAALAGAYLRQLRAGAYTLGTHLPATVLSHAADGYLTVER